MEGNGRATVDHNRTVDVVRGIVALIFVVETCADPSNAIGSICLKIQTEEAGIGRQVNGAHTEPREIHGLSALDDA